MDLRCWSEDFALESEKQHPVNEGSPLWLCRHPCGSLGAGLAQGCKLLSPRPPPAAPPAGSPSLPKVLARPVGPSRTIRLLQVLT